MKTIQTKTTNTNCILCGSNDQVTYHHLIPKSVQSHNKIQRNKAAHIGVTIPLCAFCHKNVHAIFTEAELAEECYTVELLSDHERLQKFLDWRLKHLDLSIKTKASKIKKSGGLRFT